MCSHLTENKWEQCVNEFNVTADRSAHISDFKPWVQNPECMVSMVYEEKGKAHNKILWPINSLFLVRGVPVLVVSTF